MYFNGGGGSHFDIWWVVFLYMVGCIFIYGGLYFKKDVILILFYFLCVSNQLDFNAGVCAWSIVAIRSISHKS